MSDRRQAFAREAIEIDLGDRVVTVAPVPWVQANDFGNEVVQQNVTILNEVAVIYSAPDSDIPQLSMKLAQKWTDPRRLLELGLPAEEFEKIKSVSLYDNQISAILVAAAEVNGLKQLLPILDPNLESPATLSGLVSALTDTAGEILQNASGADSSSPVSPEMSSETSPDQKSTPSSESLIESPGNSDSGISPSEPRTPSETSNNSSSPSIEMLTTT